MLITAPGEHICAARASAEQIDGDGWVGGDADCGNENYVSMSGTSMATPMVAGAIALLKQAKPSATNQELINSLMNTAVQKVFPVHPNFEEGYGRMDTRRAIDNITDCKLEPKNGVYLDSATHQCSGHDYSFSSDNQIRDNFYWSDSKKNCDCDVTYDSYITSASVNGVAGGDTGVLNTSSIEVYFNVKNTGNNVQPYFSNQFYAEVEFFKVNDYNNPLGTKIQSITTWLLGYQSGNNQGLSGAFCSLVNDPNNNYNIDPGEAVTIKCQVPASYFVSTLGNQRIMFSVKEKYNDVLLSELQPDVMIKIICNMPSIDSDSGKNYTIRGACSNYLSGAQCQKITYTDQSMCIPKCIFGSPGCDMGAIVNCLIYSNKDACEANSSCFWGLNEFYISDPTSGCSSEFKDCKDLGPDYFSFDGKCTAFTINMTSPKNSDYISKSYVPLNFSAGRQTSWIGYSLDSQSPISIPGPYNITNVPSGSHIITVYANDANGKTGSSSTVNFFYCLGDTDGNGKVDMGDVVNILGAFGGQCNKPTKPPYNSTDDLDNNCKVDMGDVAIVLGRFGKSCK